MSWLKEFVSIHSRPATRPDGRPLYSYKITADHYVQLTELVQTSISGHNRNRQASPNLPALFCLYAAETFRREHSEGPWSWNTVFEPLAVAAPGNITIGEWVTQGLKYWNRPLLKNRRGNLYLVTIACEGGLPLRLLQRENTHLSQFFREILDQYDQQYGQGYDAAEQLAQQHAYRLPRSLQQEPVYRFAGQLISKIGELQPLVADAADPIKALDEKTPDWRNQLPLRMDDKNAEVLLNGLVYRSKELAEERNAKLLWQARLINTPSGWKVEKTLQTPAVISETLLCSWLNINSVTAPRYRLLLRTPDGTQPIAWLTRTEIAGKPPFYRREWAKTKGVTLYDRQMLDIHELAIYDGSTTHPLGPGNGEPWGESPWVFVEQESTQERRWLTEGSARTRSPSAYVLVPQDVTPKPIQGQFEEQGQIPNLARTLYKVSGEVHFQTPFNDHFSIRCGAAQDSDHQFHLSGAMVVEGIQEKPLYRGLPHLIAADSTGKLLPEIGVRQCKPCGRHSAWQQPGNATLGRLWLRLLDSDGSERCRRRVDVVPNDLQVSMTFGAGNTDGEVHVTGLAGAAATLHSEHPETIHVDHQVDTLRLRCPVVANTHPATIKLQLAWPQADPVHLILPYPQRGAAFCARGAVLTGDAAVVPVDRLGSVAIQIHDSEGGTSYWLEAALLIDSQGHHHNTPTKDSATSFRIKLPHLQWGQLTYPLWQLQSRLASIFASSLDLDSKIHLKVTTKFGQELASIDVTRFDCWLSPNRDTQTVSIPESQHSRLERDWQTRMRAEMLRLWQPASEPIQIAPVPNQPGHWAIPEDLEPGPWWVIVYDGDWARFRPLLWTVKTEEHADQPKNEFNLEAIIRDPDRARRETNLHALLASLPDKPGSTDWSLLNECIDLSNQFPPASIAALGKLCHYPKALAMALFMSNEQRFDRIWRLSSEMPFLWILLPVNDWLDVSTTFYSHLDEALEALDENNRASTKFKHFQDFREMAKSRRNHWPALCDWLQEALFPSEPLPANSNLNPLRNGHDAFVDEILKHHLDELQSRHDADERWPESNAIGKAISELGPWIPEGAKKGFVHSESVRYSPFLAAHLSLNGLSASKKMIHDFRLLRKFDTKWFDFTYSLALGVGLANR
jgi:hypothetical protein